MSKEQVVGIVEKIEKINLIGESGNDVAIIEETVVEVETGHESQDAEISVELFNETEQHRKHFRAARTALLLEVLDEGAKKLDVKLLPKPQEPLDLLRGVYRDHETGQRLPSQLACLCFAQEMRPPARSP